MTAQTIHLNYTDDLARRAAQIMGYSGRHFELEITETIQLKNTYWDGGTRSQYTAINLATGQRASLPTIAPIQLGFDYSKDPINHRRMTIPPGTAMLELRTGQYTYLTIYIHPDNAPKYLPANTDELTNDEKIVLYYTSSLKSSYAGIKNYRLHEAHNRTGIEAEQWNAAKARLIEKKLLNRSGAITPEGRNAAPQRESDFTAIDGRQVSWNLFNDYKYR